MSLNNSSIYSGADASAYINAEAEGDTYGYYAYGTTATADIGGVSATSGNVSHNSAARSISSGNASVFSDAYVSAYGNAAAQGYTYGYYYADGATATASIGSVAATSDTVSLTAGNDISLNYSSVYSNASASADAYGVAGYYHESDNATATASIGSVT
jgi:hypothetical protein